MKCSSTTAVILLIVFVSSSISAPVLDNQSTFYDELTTPSEFENDDFPTTPLGIEISRFLPQDHTEIDDFLSDGTTETPVQDDVLSFDLNDNPTDTEILDGTKEFTVTASPTPELTSSSTELPQSSSIQTPLTSAPTSEKPVQTTASNSIFKASTPKKRRRMKIRPTKPTTTTISPNAVARRFGFFVSDGIRGANQVREETWRGASATGSYGIPLGDGLWQIVRYEAGKGGFRILSSNTISEKELLQQQPRVENEASIRISSDDGVDVGYRIRSEEYNNKVPPSVQTTHQRYNQQRYLEIPKQPNRQRIPTPTLSSSFKIDRIYLRAERFRRDDGGLVSVEGEESEEQDSKTEPPPPPSSSIAPRRYSFSIQDGIKGANQVREEEWKDGAITGSYVQPLGDGYWQRTTYLADSNGYRVLSTHILTESQLFPATPNQEVDTAQVSIRDDHQSTHYVVKEIKLPDSLEVVEKSTEISEED